ncbi:MAG TPA: VWA domain-containing protein [Phycisphaerae bacterium]|nr:VWA domain-containing protein [Phycisphaerae bacterium]
MPGQPPQKSSKTGWWLLLGGLGCLGLVVLLGVAALVAFLFYARSSARVAGPMPMPSAHVVSGPSVSPQDYPYGEDCRSWSQSGAVASDPALSEAVMQHVFTTYGRQAHDVLGRIAELDAATSRRSDSRSGKVTVTLSNAAGESVVLELSYMQDPVGGWIFSLDNAPFPKEAAQEDVGAAATAEPAEMQFFGVAATGSKVVYVIDRSGSMTDSIMFVKHELKRSIGMLRPTDQFLPIFFSSGPAKTIAGGRLLTGVTANKERAYEFIDNIVPIGQTDPEGALKEAFRLRPDTIYLLTDGEFDQKIVGLVARLNADKRVKVHTICFIYSNGEPMLKEIARDNGGTYKYVGEDDLNQLE